MNKVINYSQAIFSIWVHTCYLSLCDHLGSSSKNQVEHTSFIPHSNFLYRSKHLSYSQDFNAVHRITEKALPGLSCTQSINKTYTFSFPMLSSSTWLRVRDIWAYRQSGRLFTVPSFSITGLTVMTR